MKRMVAQLNEAKRSDYDPEEHGEVVNVGEHHGGDIQVYLAHKVAKLREVQAQNWTNRTSDIFRGCIMYVNGLTDPPIDEMRRLIGTNGGECIQYRAVKITHLVCNYFTDAQLKLEFAKVKLNANNRVYYVKAAWVTDSIREGRRLNENDYLPAGVDKQHGGYVQSIFNVSGSSSSASDRVKTAPRDKVLIAESEGGAVRLGGAQQLTHSQDEFVKALPEDLKQEAIAQILAQREQLPQPRKEVVDLANSHSEAGGGASPAHHASSADDAALATRTDLLTELVQHLHHNADGSHCSSKATMLRTAQYVRELIGTVCNEAPSGNSSSCSGSSRGGSSGCTSGGSSSTSAHARCQEDCCLPEALAAGVVVQDYIAWLTRCCFFDQVGDMVAILCSL